MNYFDYRSNGYGKLILPLNKYIYFLYIEATHVGGILEVFFKFYYRISDNNIIEFVIGSHLYEEETEIKHRIVGRFQLKEPFHTDLLKYYIEKFIYGGRNYYSLGYLFHDSPLINETQFEAIIDDIMANLMINKHHQNTKWKDTPIVRLCQEYGFEIIPTGNEDYISECRCPTGNSHRMTLNLESGSWFCGWCGKNGYLKELKAHFEKYKKK